MLDHGWLGTLRSEQLVAVVSLCRELQYTNLSTIVSNLSIDSVKLHRLIKAKLVVKLDNKVMVNPSLVITRAVTSLVKHRTKFGIKLHPVTGVPLASKMVLNVDATIHLSNYTKKQREATFEILQLVDSSNTAKIPRIKDLKGNNRDYKKVIDDLIDLQLIKVIGNLNYQRPLLLFFSPQLILNSFYKYQPIHNVYNSDISDLNVDQIKSKIKEEQECHFKD